MNEKSALIVEEKAESGSMKFSIVLDYCRACTWPMAIVTVVFFVLTHAASIASSFWLVKWSNAQANELAFKKNDSSYVRKVTFCDDIDTSTM
jgi:cytoskeletal protein RodZ